MTHEYILLEKYLRELPPHQEELTMSFKQIEDILKESLPLAAHEHHSWWSNQKQGMLIEPLAWMDAGWMVETVNLHEQRVKFVRQ